MTRLAAVDYLAHLRSESRRFRDVLATCDPSARVPACPDWDAADLLWHLTRVQWFSARTVRTRPAAADEGAPGPQRPASYDELLVAFDEHSASLVAELEAADPADPAWTWSSDQSVGFTFRRQAHEALIHRLDAEQTAGAVTPLDAALAADGVAELLGVMFGGIPPWGSWVPDDTCVGVECTDTGHRMLVRTGHFTGTDPDTGTAYDELALETVLDQTCEPDAVVTGPAAALDAWLWRRGDDRHLHVTGDRAVYDRFRQAVDHPIE